MLTREPFGFTREIDAEHPSRPSIPEAAARCALVRACLSELLQRIINSKLRYKASDSCGEIDDGIAHMAAATDTYLRMISQRIAWMDTANHC